MQLSAFVKTIGDNLFTPGKASQIVFELSKPDSSTTVHMRIDEPNFNGETVRVVIVNADKFQAAWKNGHALNDHLGDLAHGNVKSWKEDRKYRDTDRMLPNKGFDVVNELTPLTQVSCSVFQPKKTLLYRIKKMLRCSPKGNIKYQLGFGGGVTRIIWLLANGYKEFPVECPENQAELLFAAAGATQSKVFQPFPLDARYVGQYQYRFAEEKDIESIFNSIQREAKNVHFNPLYLLPFTHKGLKLQLSQTIKDGVYDSNSGRMKAKLLVVFKDLEFAGFSWIHEVRREVWELYLLAVEPKHRGQKIAESLIDRSVFSVNPKRVIAKLYPASTKMKAILLSKKYVHVDNDDSTEHFEFKY